MIVKCPGCKATIEIPDFQKPTITNLPACSVIVFEHPATHTCTCGQEMAPLVVSVDRLQVAARDVQRVALKSNIILPGRPR